MDEDRASCVAKIDKHVFTKLYSNFNMKKKIIIPVAILLLIAIFVVVKNCGGNSGKIKVEWTSIGVPKPSSDSIELKVYVENSGSMDAYMCPGSDLKDAVFDYVSDLKKYAYSTWLFYINSDTIVYSGELNSFIKDLTPKSFKDAGGDRSQTDLRRIFELMMENQDLNTITVFVSDCILDIPESATDFFGNCQVSIKNTFNGALNENPELGVMIIKLYSKVEGKWYCGKHFEKLAPGSIRPYYIWVIGDRRKIAFLNQKKPVDNIYGGISNYCAYSKKPEIPFCIEKEMYVVPHTKKINIEVSVDMSSSLQSNLLIEDINQYKTSNTEQIMITSVEKIKNENNPYSHVINIEITNPETIKKEKIYFSYPYVNKWVVDSNDSTGTDVLNNMDKTTGILSLVKGVAEAYSDADKSSIDGGSFSFELKNK